MALLNLHPVRPGIHRSESAFRRGRENGFAPPEYIQKLTNFVRSGKSDLPGNSGIIGYDDQKRIHL